MPLLHRLRSATAHNLATLRQQPLAELSGSVGDLGTLLPLLIALTLTNAVSLSATLVFTGLANIGTGLVFGIPLPVQPMKAVAAVALARPLSLSENIAAGVGVAAGVALLAGTRMLRWVARRVPVPVVKGIQVGAGLSLVLSAGGTLFGPLSWTRPAWSDNLLWALGAAAGLWVVETRRAERVPYALVVFIVGVAVAGVEVQRLGSSDGSWAPFHVWSPQLVIPSWNEFRTGALAAGLGQLPLTVLNSVIAVTHLSADLLPEVTTPGVTEIGFSVAIVNLVGCWFGMMPACHGSGGLAGQYKFGARSGASVIMLGIMKLLLGLFVGDGMIELLKKFPKALLGVMVVAAGIELAKVGESLNAGARDLWEEAENEADEGGLSACKRVRDLSSKERADRWSVMMITVAGMLAFKNVAVGFLLGMTWHYGLQKQEGKVDIRMDNIRQRLSRWLDTLHNRSGNRPLESLEENRRLLG